MIFKKFLLEDKEKIEKFTQSKNENSCEFTFYNLFVWQDTYGYRYAIEDGVMYLRVGKEGNYIYALPFGDCKKGMEKLKQITGEEYPAVWCQQGERFNRFISLYGKDYCAKELRDEFDYLYLREDLVNLSGKKYHSKRNHISAFSKAHAWTFEPIDKTNINDVRQCAKQWYSENSDRLDKDMAAEREGLFLLLSHLNGLDILGGVIKADNKAVAFTLGSKINESTFDIYIEKALEGYLEAYTVINREFAEKMLGGYKYINREDDLGLEGLRKSKLSYHPYSFVKKYFCTKKDMAALKKIYCEAFGQSPEFDTALFENFSQYIEELSENGKPVSMLFKIPAVIQGRKYYYIYAAATDKEYRNKGYMSKLISGIKKTADAPLFLVPSGNSLVSFYEKLGFYKAQAVKTGGTETVEMPKEFSALQKLCDECPESFTVMFSEKPRKSVYGFCCPLM